MLNVIGKLVRDHMIFSGIGTLLFGVALVYFGLYPNGSISPNTPVIIESIKVQTGTLNKPSKGAVQLGDTLSPSGILNRVESATPQMRDEVVNSIKGITVSWDGEIVDMIKVTQREDSNNIWVTVRVNDEFSPFINFGIDSSDYKGLKLLPKGKKIHFTGEIGDVKRGTIWLSNAKMTY